MVTIGLLSCSLIHQQPKAQPYFLRWISENTTIPVIAILPFTNQTDQTDLPELVRSAFYCHFSLLPFKDLEISVIDTTLKSSEKHQQKQYSSLSSRELRDLLGCQAVVYGEVTTFTRLYAGLYSQISIGAEIKIIEVAEGRTIWEDSFTTRFHEGGIPLTPVNAVFSVVKSGLNLRPTQELRAIDDLCRNLVTRIPRVTLSNETEGKNLSLCELQIAAFRDLSRAQSLQKELQRKKYVPFVRTVVDGGVTWHRVLLGPFHCGEEADAWKEKITTECGMTPIVLQNQAITYPQ